MSELRSIVADVIELLLCIDGVVLAFEGITPAKFEVIGPVTTKKFEILVGVTGPEIDEFCEISGNIAD